MTIDQPATATRSEGLQRATLPSRAFSHLIDGIILAVPLWALAFGIAAVFDVRSSLVHSWLYALLAPVYEIGFVATSGMTPGRYVLSIRIARLDGARPGLRASVIRYLVAPIYLLADALAVAPLSDTARTIIGVVIGAAWVWTIVRDPQRRGWHDKAAGTMVLDERD